MGPFVVPSIRQRLGLSLVALVSVFYGLLILNTEQVLSRDRLQRHQRLVMATAEAVHNEFKHADWDDHSPLLKSASPAEASELQEILNDFSAIRVMVWLSRPSQPPIFPTAHSVRAFLDTPGLMDAAGVNASGMQLPRSFVFAGQTYFTCSMPLPEGHGVLRFLEDVGVSPTSRRENAVFLFCLWVGLVLITAFVVGQLVGLAIRPLTRLQQAVESFRISPSGEVEVQSLQVNEQPKELQPIAMAYNRLADRLQLSWSQQQLFIRAMSHELLTPITLIASSTRRLLRRTPDLPASERDLLISVQDEARRVDRLVRDLLDLSRGDSGKLSLVTAPFQACALLRQLNADVQLLPWGDRLVVDAAIQQPESDRYWVMGDAERFRQCVLNVLENAVKYSPESSRISLSMQVADRSMYVRVLDHGKGIPVEERQKVFEPFYRVPGASSENPGSGVGLAIVRLLMERMGGTVAVIDHQGPGTCMQFTLPLTEQPS